MSRRSASILLACTVAASIGCEPTAPRLAATGTGDVSHALTSRTGPNQAYRDACSQGKAPKMSSRFARQPYLQAVSAHSARILFWLDAEPDAPIDVSVSSAAATDEVFVTTPVTDPSAVTPQGVLQMEARFDGLRPATSYCYVIDGLSEPVG